ncbi:hypothetical protein [Rubrobacter indicoceani]|uniref:hypothetical protein n=1 Tax=Rubrobacter indicoceani TaxID=2051957 RepID=UPI0013C49EEA|nr:hypothetical protein [Rubrobacter indicoceani]
MKRQSPSCFSGCGGSESPNQLTAASSIRVTAGDGAKATSAPATKGIDAGKLRRGGPEERKATETQDDAG